MLFGIVADDNTGASDAAGMLAACGISTVLALRLEVLESAEVVKRIAGNSFDALVVGTQSRSVPVREAYDRTVQALQVMKRLEIPQVQIKYCSTFDSTAEGNIGQMLDAALDVYGTSQTIVLPALPVNGRTTYHGYHYVYDALLADSPLRHHPINPMTESNLLKLLSTQTKRKAGLLRLETILECSQDAANPIQTGAAAKEVGAPGGSGGTEAAGAADAVGVSGAAGVTGGTEAAEADSIGRRLQQLRDEQTSYIVSDAVLQEHIDIVTEHVKDWPVLSGGSGITASWGKLKGREAALSDWQGRLDAIPKKTLVISGSCSQMTLKQLAYAESSGFAVYRLPVKQILLGAWKLSDHLRELQKLLNDHEKLIVSSSAQPEELQEIHNFAEGEGMDPLKAGETISHTLGMISRELLNQNIPEAERENASRKHQHKKQNRHDDKGAEQELDPYAVGRIIAAGGETSGAVCRYAGLDFLEVGFPAAPGVPFCFPVNRPDLMVVLKSGNFGDEELYEKIYSL
ncbi:MAG: four-carbon acid sugar kinase family protein [Spirochaetia bacterium]|nr:four-carbon acid sugar kinase family protein [Spirochaetia bacterium]